MTHHNCEVCRGEGRIRLPLYRRATASFKPSEIASIEESSRSYPCPECTETTPQGRLSIIQHHTLMDARIDDHSYMEIAKKDAGHRLVGGLLNAGFISFKRGPPDFRGLSFPVQATIGVVSPKHVADLQTRIAEHQEKLALEVMAEADCQINNWGSHYGHSDILKRDARRLIGEALRDVLAKRASWKEA